MVSRRAVVVAGLCAATRPPAALAVMVGEAPDSPLIRIDPNRPSSRWTGVGSLVHRGGVYTASLIGPRHALTAGHVAPDDIRDMRFALNIEGDLSHEVEVVRAHRHPGFRGASAGTLPRFDIAVLELAVPAPSEARVYPLSRTSPSSGQLLTFVGYGASGPGSRGPVFMANAAIKRTGTNRIARIVQESEGGGKSALLLFEFAASPGRQTGLASGDSGGPAFVIDGERSALTAVNSAILQPSGRTPFGYGSIGVGQLVAPLTDWIEATVRSRT